MVNEDNAQSEQDSQSETVANETNVDNLQTDIDAAQQALADAHDKLLRSKAEAENIRRRAILDVENAHKYGVEKIARELLNVVDSLEKGMEAATGSGEEQIANMREGMELTHKLLLATLEKFNIRQVDPQGQMFDPKFHEALTAQPSGDVKPNTILTVIQKGFVIHDRVLRPARVIVAKAP